MPVTKPNFPPVRACIFDMDGLLINSEEIITTCLNRLLAKYGRPSVPRAVRVQLMGIPDSTNSDTFHNWAQLPIPRDRFKAEMKIEMERHFTECKPLTGAETLLANLRHATNSSGDTIGLALASTSTTSSYQLKTSTAETKCLLSNFGANRRILGDDVRVRQGHVKPAPDIYLVALQALSATAGPDDSGNIRPEECLVFEDSVVGVEAGRRAGMRVVWVPHPDVAAELQDVIKEVLAARSGERILGDDWQSGEIDDGWAECISSLEDFDYNKYGIRKAEQ